jgi:hypothetical protein
LTFLHDLRYKTTPMSYFLRVFRIFPRVKTDHSILFPSNGNVFALFMNTAFESALQIVVMRGACVGLSIVYPGGM